MPGLFSQYEKKKTETKNSGSLFKQYEEKSKVESKKEALSKPKEKFAEKDTRPSVVSGGRPMINYDQKKLDHAAGSATAFLENTVDSATLGAIPAVANLLGKKEFANSYKSGLENDSKRHEVASTLGNLAGYVVPFAGASRIAKPLVKNLKVGKNLIGPLTKTQTVVNKILPLVTAGVAEGAIVGGAEGGIKGESILKNAADMAGLGVVGNLGIAGAGKVLGKILKPIAKEITPKTLEPNIPAAETSKVVEAPKSIKKANIINGNMKITVPKLEQAKNTYAETIKKATDFYGTNNFAEGIRKVDTTRPTNVIKKMFDDNTISKNKTKSFLNNIENRTNLSKEDYEILDAFYPELIEKHKISPPDSGIRVMKRVQQDTGVNILGAQNKLENVRQQSDIRVMGKNLRETKSNLKSNVFGLETALSKRPIQNDISVKFETGSLPKSLENMTKDDFNIVVGELKKSANNMKYGEGTRQAITRDLAKVRELRGITTKEDRLAFDFNDGSASDVKSLPINSKPINSTSLDTAPITVPGTTATPQQTVQVVNNLGTKITPENRDAVINDLLKDSDKWKDKGAASLQRETHDRNIVDVAGAKDGGKIKDQIFTPIHENEAARIRFNNDIRNKVKALKLSKEERAAVQKFGEGQYTLNEKVIDLTTGKTVETPVMKYYTLDDLKTEFPNSWEKISNSTQVFRDFYNGVIDQANDVLLKNGYKAIPKRENYFPHFQADDPVLKALGIKLDVAELPTDINGLTHQFKPNKNWVGNFIKRTGNQTSLDAVEGLDRYIEGVSKVIYHTDDIKNLRTLSRGIRSKYSSTDIQAQVESIKLNKELAEEAKDVMVDDLLGRSNTQLSKYVADLDEYTNVLAGKKDLADRAMERQFGRKAYNVANTVINRVGKNMVAVNPASWLTNLIPLTQSISTTGKKEFIQAMGETIGNVFKNDGFVNKSTFLTNRYGSDILSKGATDIAGDVLSQPMRWIDHFTSNVITRSKYLENIKKGMPEETAMKQADEWAAKIIGDRSLGAQPTLFNQSNPLTRLVTQFQLEVNNQVSFLLKDMPREYLKDGANAENIARLTNALGQVAVAGYMYNVLYEKITGRKPAIDPIGTFADFKKDLDNPNLKASDAVTNAATNSIRQLPFVGGLINGGRIPISAAAPDFGKMANVLIKTSTGEMDKGQALKDVGSSLSNTALYVVPPFGGGQLKKTIQSVDAINKGGVYTPNGKQLKYPIKKNLGNSLTGGIFGISALDETKEYYNNSQRPLSEKQTNKLERLKARGKDTQESYNKILTERNIEKIKAEMAKVRKNRELESSEKFRQIEKLKSKLDKMRSMQ